MQNNNRVGLCPTHITAGAFLPIGSGDAGEEHPITADTFIPGDSVDAGEEHPITADTFIPGDSGDAGEDIRMRARLAFSMKD